MDFGHERQTWDAVAKFSGPPGPGGGFHSLSYSFKYYAFDKDHVQGFAACA